VRKKIGSFTAATTNNTGALFSGAAEELECSNESKTL